MVLLIYSLHCGFGGCLIFSPQSIEFADVQLICPQCHHLISLPPSISNFQMGLIIRAFASLVLELFNIPNECFSTS